MTASTRPFSLTPYRELNEQYWSRGTSVREPLPLQPREEQPVETMTVGDLIRTQWIEPETESRKAWRETGAGALSLDALANHDARRYGTPYIRLDPDVASQIAWEQRAYYTGPVITARLEGGRLQLDRFVDRQTFNRLRRRLPEYGIGAGPQPRYILTDEAFRAAKRRVSETINAEIRRQTAPAPLEFHSSYEVTDKGSVVARVHRPGKPEHRDSFWRHEGIDQAERELGTNCMADDELEECLGL